MRQNIKFYFYEDYCIGLNNLTDADAGEFIKYLLSYAFNGKEYKKTNSKKARALFGLVKLNVKPDEKQASKSRKHFIFYKEYQTVFEYLDNVNRGRLIKLICSYMFDDAYIIEEKYQDLLTYFQIMKRTLDKSKNKSHKKYRYDDLKNNTIFHKKRKNKTT